MPNNKVPRGGINITCAACCHTFAFDESKIPDGEKYETKCPFCGVTLIRRKISLKELSEFKKKIVEETGRKAAIHKDKKEE